MRRRPFAAAGATRRRVEDAIDALGFRPGRAARELAGKEARSLTVLTSDTSPYGAASLAARELVANRSVSAVPCGNDDVAAG
ncbi:hypothetical protein [Streptomyces sp. NPDC019937]|uniref:hypothetical protein n=1 Tax=Streptomyces sp. NPDC019937 TaxID=3154787 RepID=UPI0033C4C359